MKGSYISLATIFFALFGCNQPDIIEPQHMPGRSYQIVGDEVDTRVFLNENLKLCWNASDELSLFWSEANVKYIFCGKEGSTAGPILVADKETTEGAELGRTYALYPYHRSATINPNGTISTQLPKQQAYIPNSMAREANLMVAVTENAESTELFLRNACGYLRLQLYGTDVSLMNVTLKGNDGEHISGKCSIVAQYNREPQITMDGDSNDSVILNCGGLTLSSSAQNTTDLIFVLPPITFANGISITATDITGKEFTMSTSNEVPIIRNTIQTMEAVEVIPQDWGEFSGLTAPQSIEIESSAVVSESLGIGCTEEAVTVETTAQWMGLVGGKATVSKGAVEELKLWAEPNLSTQTRYAPIVVTGTTSGHSLKIFVSQPPQLNTITEALPARLETQKSSYTYSDWDSKGVCYPKNSSATFCAVATNGEALTYRRDGGPIVEGMKEGDYLLFAVPTKSVNAGEQLDFMCTLAAVDGNTPKYFIFEYWDNDQWNCIEESLITAADNPSLKYSLYCQVFENAHNTTFTQSFTLDQPVNNECVKVRLRALTEETGSIRIPNSAGYMGMYLINYPKAPQQITDRKKILFIGNSYTYYYGTAFMFKEISRSQGHQVDAVISVKGAQEFKEHLELQLSQDAIKQGGYDYAFLQDSSPNAAYYADKAGKDQSLRQTIREKCEEINDLAHQYSPNCQIMYERTWACPYEEYRGYGSYDRLDCFLKKGIEMLQKKVADGVRVSPIGLGFRVGRDEGLELLYTDDRHQNRAGAYMKACINYLTIYGERFTSNVSDCAVDAPTAQKIREIAERVVFEGVAETANSYIVKKGEKFSFLADIMGNGNIPAGSAISSTALSGKSVGVLWSTFNTGTAPESNDILIKDLTISNDIVTFTAGEKVGNAVIALYDSAGNILWSWHIWICDDIKEQSYNDHTWLDRNLGALSAEAGNDLSLGLFYQFGRKDPFRGSAAKNANTSIVTTGSWPDPKKETSSPETYAIANPMQLLLRQNKTTTDDWFAADEAGQNNALWSADGKKTMYDPCPRGYRVPEQYAWNIGHAAGSAFFTTSNFTYDSSKYCRIYKSGDVDVNYPIAGCLSASDGSLTKVGTTGYYRTANKHTADPAHAEILEFTESTVNTAKGNFRSSAYSVRCVKE